MLAPQKYEGKTWFKSSSAVGVRSDSTNVSIVRHIKATVGCWKPRKKKLFTTKTSYNRILLVVSGMCSKPQPTDRHLPPGSEAKFARWCRGDSGTSFCLSPVLSVSGSATATLKDAVSWSVSASRPLLWPPVRFSWLVWRNKSAEIHSYSPFSSHRTAAPSALCSSLAMTRQGDGSAFTQTCRVNQPPLTRMIPEDMCFSK